MSEAHPCARGSCDLALARAHWLDPSTITWAIERAAATRLALWSDPEGALAVKGSNGISNWTQGESSRSWELEPIPEGLSPALRARFPHLAHLPCFRLPPEATAEAPAILRGQLAVCATNGDGRLEAATSLQTAGVLDALYASHASILPLGPRLADERVTLRVWAPTARSVKLRLFDAPRATAFETLAMTRDDPSGTWSASSDRSRWYGKYYLFEVEVYVRSTGRTEHNLVTDPYAVALSKNSQRSQLVSLDDPALQPTGWRSHAAPSLAAPTDISLYELHVRDFSAHDASVPEPLRGTFAAFAQEDSVGMRHLAQLAQSGLTHLHLLPAFDFTTVDDDRAAWRSPAFEVLERLPPDSEEQQRLVMADASADGFNWGYDPFHYTVPEGSYATEPDGPTRTFEFRQMVQSIHHIGLRVVMDVVYNHTFGAGQSPSSVLDRIVPGYYYRLDGDGRVLSESCCPDTATETAMMTKLMVDSVVSWARHYRLDGFRFDIMGLHMKSSMLAVRAALDALTLERDGVDGRSIYLYGEGWNYGAVADGARGQNATQLQMAGTGIGTFCDRLRDAVRGGGHLHPRRAQGFATGLFLEPNGTFGGSSEEERAFFLHLTDLVRLAMAGNLADYVLTDSHGQRITGQQLSYYGQSAGYARRPDDAIIYISCHDNPTWFDAMNVKVRADLGMAERVRIHNLGLSIVALSQGIPFFLAGDELLRSKSADGNSYSSGDWFNRLDFTLRSHGWGSGLPPAPDNKSDWPLLRPLLADPRLKPGQAEMTAAFHHMQEMLRIRYSSRLFRLRDAAAIHRGVTFLNVGPDQQPGLLVMHIAEAESDARVPPTALATAARAELVLLINVTPASMTFYAETLRGTPLALHPVQTGSYDPVVRTARFEIGEGRFDVPARTAAVFVTARAVAGDSPHPTA